MPIPPGANSLLANLYGNMRRPKQAPSLSTDAQTQTSTDNSEAGRRSEAKPVNKIDIVDDKAAKSASTNLEPQKAPRASTTSQPPIPGAANVADIGDALEQVYAAQSNEDSIRSGSLSATSGRPASSERLAQAFIDPFLLEEPPILERPTVPYPTDPNSPPGDGWEFRGPPGEGSWYNPETKESLRPDLDHPPGVDPHWDWKSPSQQKYRWFPDGNLELKT